MPSPATILVVDDEIAIRLTLEDILTRDGHHVITAEDGRAALALIDNQVFDLALLDVNLGDITGTEVLVALHQQSPDTIVIMLTAYASVESAVTALRQGAHDYLFKPCQPEALRKSVRQGLLKRRQIIRQRSVLHQLGQYLASNLDDIQAVLKEDSASFEINQNQLQEADQQAITTRQGELKVDFSRHVIIINNQPLELSPTEFKLLAYLIRVTPRVVSPQELIREVQGYESEPWEANETIRAHIYNIRQKIKRKTGCTGIIRTVRGAGYAIGE